MLTHPGGSSDLRRIFPKNTLPVAAVAALVVSILPLWFRGPLSKGAILLPANAPAATIAKLPLAFEQNTGQTDPVVRSTAHAPGADLFFTASGVVAAQTKPGD